MEGKLFSFATVLCLCALIGQLHSSAIPMWEFLSKDEKMSYLYSMFANQVEDFCSTASMNNCNQDLLKYGLNKLKVMPEDHLDTMDPYQRGANNIIWDSMMEGHEMMKTTLNPRSTSTAKPNSYEDESMGDLDFGTQTAASAKIDNVYRVAPPKGFVVQLQTGTPQYTYPHNVVPYLNTFDKINQNRNNEGVYNRFQQQYTAQNFAARRTPEEVPLTGPMVVKVYPDGSPVRENVQPLPQDEDLRQYKLSKIQIPSF